MGEKIRNFFGQFQYDPVIENWAGPRSRFARYAVGGMGGSHLAADLLKTLRPELNLVIHSDYGLPALSDAEAKETLFIASSYSGETEETIDFLASAAGKNYPALVVSTGGRLLDLAKEKQLPFIRLPSEPVLPPRLAMGYGFLALALAVGETDILTKAKTLSSLSAAEAEAKGKELAEKIATTIPLIYASDRNKALAYHFKVDLNETAKTPAFINAFPELNHNEIAGFEPGADKFSFIFLKDDDDDPRLSRREDVFKEILPTAKIFELALEGKDRLEKIFFAVLSAEWTGYHLALKLGRDPEENALIQEFKKRLTA